MLAYVKILVLCTLAGCLLATVFMNPGGAITGVAIAGALKGLLLGLFITWGEYRNSRRVQVVSYIER